MNISKLLERNARKYPLHEAIITSNNRLNYKELNRLVTKLASSLQQNGVKQGDKVILFMPNTPEFVISYFAVLRLGAIVVPINAKLVQSEVEYIIDHCEANAIIVHEMLYNVVSTLTNNDIVYIKTGKSLNQWKSFESLLADGVESTITCNLNEDDNATILYTSGTTGRPKGVLFTYRNILSAAIMMCVEMEMKPESRLLHLMPLSHSAPLHLFLVAGTYVGAAHILSPMFTPEILLSLTQNESATHFFGAPVAYLLTAKTPTISSYNLDSMKYWVYGGAPLSTSEIAFIKNAFQTENLYCVYGLTEAGPTGTLLLPHEHELHAGSIGRRGALGTEIKIVQPNGELVEPGEVGEILLDGEGVMKEYYKDAEQTKEAFTTDGWLKTGDLGKYDETGYIWIVDRKKDMIISGGTNIYPKEIEDLLITHPLIEAVAVVGIPHQEWGETVKAFITSSEQIPNLNQLCTEFLTNKIASYKIPKLYEQVAELPRNASGKILKQQLRDSHKNEVKN